MFGAKTEIAGQQRLIRDPAGHRPAAEQTAGKTDLRTPRQGDRLGPRGALVS
jgi:hypothetical protein